MKYITLQSHPNLVTEDALIHQVIEYAKSNNDNLELVVVTELDWQNLFLHIPDDLINCTISHEGKTHEAFQINSPVGPIYVSTLAEHYEVNLYGQCKDAVLAKRVKRNK